MSASAPVAERPAPKAAWVVPKLPSAKLSWHVVARAEDSIKLWPLENAAIAQPFSSDGMSVDALLLQSGKARLLKGLFRGVTLRERESAAPIEGAWPEPLLLTVGRREYRAHPSNGRVLVRRGAQWEPLVAELSSRPGSILVPPINGQRRLIAFEAHGYSVWSFPEGVRAPLHIQPAVDGRDYRLEAALAGPGASLLLGGLATEQARDDKTIPIGSVIVQRFEPGRSTPIIDRMPAPGSELRTMSGMVSAGNKVWIALHETGARHYLAGFDGRSWQLEPLPIPRDCWSSYIFEGAPDGSVFLAPAGCTLERGSMIRRDSAGAYAAVDFPRAVQSCKLWPESATLVWMACVAGIPNEGLLYSTRAGFVPRKLRGSDGP